MKGVRQILLLLLPILVNTALRAHADTVIQTVIDEEVSVECFAFLGAVVQKNFGLWYMEFDQLDLLQLTPLNSMTTGIYCHFVWLGGNAHQYFPVYLKSGGPSCDANCSWTIDLAGFTLLDPVSDEKSLMYPWITGPDSYVPPSR